MELKDLERREPPASLPSLAICYPFVRPHPDKFLRSLVNLAGTPGGVGEISFYSLFGFSTDVARNVLSATAVAGKPDYILMLDNDCEFQPEAVFRLVSHNYPVVCGSMYTRTTLPRPTMGMYLGKNKKGKHIYSFSGIAKQILQLAAKNKIDHENATDAMCFPNPHPIEIDGCGMHFTMIRRDVLEAVKPPWFAFEGAENAGEDFYFCRKVREAGFKIYADLSVHTGHIDSEDHTYGLKELLYLTQYLDVENNLVEEGNWEVG